MDEQELQELIDQLNAQELADPDNVAEPVEFEKTEQEADNG